MATRFEDVTVILRSIGERTTDACHDLLKEQVYPEQITKVENLSYDVFVTRTYEIGLAEDRRFTVVVDADVLPRHSMVKDLRSVLQAADDDLFAVEGQVQDKLFGGPRHAGNTFYRTEALNEIIEHVPESSSVARPESAAIKVMIDQGYRVRWLKDCIVGLHEFKQSYEDLYRKGTTFVGKRKYLVPVLQPYWERKAHEDPDFELLLRQTAETVSSNQDIDFEASNYDGADELLSTLGLNPKPPLQKGDVTEADVEAHIKITPPPEFTRYQRISAMRDHPMWPRLPRIGRYLAITMLQKRPREAIPWTLKQVLSQVRGTGPLA